jgi:hypothetical protein
MYGQLYSSSRMLNQGLRESPERANAGFSALYIALSRRDGTIRLDGLEAFVPPLIALPERFDAGLSVSLPGEAPAARGETPHPLAEWGRGRRRVAVRRHHLPGGPGLGVEDHRTGPLGRGTARQREVVEPPGHAHVHRQGIQSALSRRHAPLCHVASVREPSAKEVQCPPTALPRHDPAGPWAIRPRPTRQPPPRPRCRARRWRGLLGLDRADRHGRPVAAWPTRPLEGHGCGRDCAGDRAGRPLRWAGQGDGAGAQGARLRQLGPPLPRRGTRRQTPLFRGAQDPRGPVAGLPAPPVHQPRLEIACAIDQGHHHGRRTGRLDRTGAVLPFEPAVTLLLRQGFPVPRRGHRRFRPRPDLQSQHTSRAARGRKRHRGLQPIRCTRCARDGAQARLRRGRAVMQPRGIVPQPPDRLRAAARQRGVGLA